MNDFILIENASNVLRLEDYLHDLQDAAAAGHSVVWNKEGHVRLIPNAALQNALNVYADFMVGIDRVGGKMPADVGVIYWEQAFDFVITGKPRLDRIGQDQPGLDRDPLSANQNPDQSLRTRP